MARGGRSAKLFVRSVYGTDRFTKYPHATRRGGGGSMHGGWSGSSQDEELETVLQLGGQSLQLGGEDLVLGA